MALSDRAGGPDTLDPQHADPGAFDWRATIAFVDQSGSEIERARLRGVLGRARTDARILRVFESRQNEDGGFPHAFVPGRLSTIDATATAIEWLFDLGLGGGACAERACVHLLAAQRPDGGWDEPPGLLKHSPPPRLLPGDPRVRCRATALVVYWLARVGDREDAIRRALGYLAARQAANGRLLGFLQTTWLAAAAFRMVDGPAAEPAARALAALAAVPPDRWYPGALAGMLGCLGEAGVGAPHPPVRAGLARLCALARPDGSWLSEDGDLYHVEASLQALRAMVVLGETAPPPVPVPAGAGGAEAGERERAAAEANLPEESLDVRS